MAAPGAVDIPANNGAEHDPHLERRGRGLRARLHRCDPAANGECGPCSDLTFGQVEPPTGAWPPMRGADSTSRATTGRRQWSFSTSCGRTWRSTSGYYRTWYGNFLVTDNLAVTPADYDHFCITAPTDSRLPSESAGSPSAVSMTSSRRSSVGSTT